MLAQAIKENNEIIGKMPKHISITLDGRESAEDAFEAYPNAKAPEPVDLPF